MWVKATIVLTLPGLLGFSAPSARAAELQTLFTTTSERQLINANRYKTDREPEVEVVENDEKDLPPVRYLLHEEVTRAYTVSGVSLSRDGNYTVWINSQSYEDGGKLEDSSRVEVLAGDEIRIRITTPDGKQHYALSGETLDVTFLSPLTEHTDNYDPHDRIRE